MCTIYTILSQMSSESSKSSESCSELSSFCSLFPEVTRVSVSSGVGISVSGVNADSGLDWGSYYYCF